MNSPLYKSAEGERAVMAFCDQLLELWPPPFEARSVATRHGSTFVISTGDSSRPPLVLLHGACSNSFSWLGDVAAYSRHFHVHAVDFPGEAGKSSPNRLPWEGPAIAEWLEDVLAVLGLEQTHLLGLSLGGWVALKFATHHPERVSRLVLLGPGGVAPARLSFLLRAIPLTLFGRRGAEMINRITFGDEPAHPVALEFMNLIMTHFRPRIDAQPMFTDGQLRRLTMPVLLIGGARDALLPTEKITARLAKAVPHLTANVLPDKGHVLVGLTDQIIPFLTERRPPA